MPVSAFDAGVRLLALREHSVWELRRKLKPKGYPEAELEAALARLQELGYLNDARFARVFAASAVRNGRFFGARLAQELKRRGVAPELVREVLAELAREGDEADDLARLIARRFAGFDPASATDKERRRVVGYLTRKGFSLPAVLQQLKIHSTY